MKAIDPLPLHSPLIQTSKLLSFTPEPNAIGWDNWTPIDSTLNSSFDLDGFDAREISPEVSQLDSVFATTIFTSKLEPSNDIDDSFSTIDRDIEPKQTRSKSSTKKKPSSAKERKISPKTKPLETINISPNLGTNNQSLDVSIPDNLPSPSTLINPSILPSNSSPSTNKIALQIEAMSIGEAMDGLISDIAPSTSTIINLSPSTDTSIIPAADIDGLITDNSTILNPASFVEATPIPTAGVGIAKTMDGLISDISPSASTIINPSPSTDASIIPAAAIDRLAADNPTILNPASFVEATPIPTAGVGIGETMDGLVSDISPSASSTINPLPSTDASIIPAAAIDELIADNPTIIHPASSTDASIIPAETIDGLIADNPTTLNPSPSTDASIIPAETIDGLIADNSTILNPASFVEATPIPTEGVRIGEAMDGLVSDISPSASTTIINPSPSTDASTIPVAAIDGLTTDNPPTIINPASSVEATPIPSEGVGIGETMDGLISDIAPSTPTTINPSPSTDASIIPAAAIDGLITDNPPTIHPASSVEATPIPTEGVRIGEAMDGLVSDISPSASTTTINPPPSTDASIIPATAIDGLVADNPTIINPPSSTDTSIIPATAIDRLVVDNPTIINPSPSVESTSIQTEGMGIGETTDGLIADNPPSASSIINPSPSVESTAILAEGVGIGETMDGLVADNSPSASSIINPSPSIESSAIPGEGVGIGETMDGLIADNSPSASSIINPSPSVVATPILAEGVGIGVAMDGVISDNIVFNQLRDRTSTNDRIANPPETDLSIAEDKSTKFDDSKTKLNLEAEPSILKEGELPLIPIDVDDTTPIVVKGYATGGHVLEPDRVDRKPIAASDIIPAMLTPGEFVINAKDAQKNLDLLTHINSGGELDRSNLVASDSTTPATDNSIDIDRSTIQRQNLRSNLIQLKSHESLVSPSLQADLDPDRNSYLNSSPNVNINRSIVDVALRKSNTNYSSPPLIFRKAQSNIASALEQDTPDEWNSIEDLMNGMNNFSEPRSSTNENLEASQSIRPNRDYANESPSSTNNSLQPSSIYPKTIPPTDTSTQLESVSTTISAPTTNDRENDDAGELEILAREVYHRLRQRLEIERERHGNYSGNLPW